MLNTRKVHYLLLFTMTYTVCALDINDSHASSHNTQSPELTLPSTDSKKQKARKRKTRGEKKRKISTYRDMTYEELLVAKNQFIEQKNYASAIKYLEQMMKLCSDIALIGDILIEIADLLCLEGHFFKASQKYAEYVALYPGGEKLEYALFKTTECSFACILSCDRDQTKTEETLTLAEGFLKQDHFTTYAEQVRTIRDKCYEQLAQSELNICSFYLHRGQLKPAEKRLNDIRTNWLSKVPSIESSIIAYEADLIRQKEELEQKNAKTLLAANNKTKHMAQRF